MICALNVKSTFGRITTKTTVLNNLSMEGSLSIITQRRGGHFLHTLRSMNPEFSCLSKLKMDLFLIYFSY